MKKYDYQGTVLEVKQGYGQNDIDISTLNSMMFKDIYQDSQIKIAQLDSKVDSLRNVITNYKQFRFYCCKNRSGNKSVVSYGERYRYF